MRIARTLSGYIARQFLTWFGAVFGTIISIAFLLDYIELIRRSGSREQATWGVLLEMAALKLPHTAQDVMPFVVLERVDHRRPIRDFVGAQHRVVDLHDRTLGQDHRALDHVLQLANVPRPRISA